MPRAARRLAAVAPFPRDGVGQRPHARSDADSRALACRCPRFENREEYQVQGVLGVRGQLFSVRPSQLGCGTARVHPYAGSVSSCSRLVLSHSERIDLTLLATPSRTTTRVPTSRSRPTRRTRWRVWTLPTRHPLWRAPNRSTRPTRPSCESDGQDRVSGPQRPPRAVRSTCLGTVLHPRDARSRASPFAERGLGSPRRNRGQDSAGFSAPHEGNQCGSLALRPRRWANAPYLGSMGGKTGQRTCRGHRCCIYRRRLRPHRFRWRRHRLRNGRALPGLGGRTPAGQAERRSGARLLRERRHDEKPASTLLLALSSSP